MNNEKVIILGVPIARLNMAEVVEWVEKRIMENTPAHLVTANAEIIFRATQEAKLSEVLQQADLITADGFGAVWAAKILKRPVPERVTGIDLVQRLFAVAEEKGWGIYFLGAKPEVVEKAVLNTLSKHSRLKVCGYMHGYFSQEETRQVVANILKSKPDLLLVALGAPQQEYFIRAQQEQLAIPVAIGVGGSFDVLAGTVQRAPRWMQELGLEWLYRLVKEPRRLRRMLALPRFVLAVLGQKIFHKWMDKN